MRASLLLLAGVTLAGCVRLSDLNPTEGSGKIASETRSPGSFTKIELGGAMDVHVIAGDSESIRIDADDNLLPLIETVVDAGELEISTREAIEPTVPVKIYVTTRMLESLKIAGSGNIVMESPFNASHFTLAIAGSGDVAANVVAESIKASIAGSGDISLKGSSNTAEINIAGSGDVRAYDLSLQRATVHIAGSGDCELQPSDELTARIMGSGSVYYRGNPKISESVMGSGSLVKR